MFWLIKLCKDNWDHKIDFVSSSLTSSGTLKVIGATACGPLDDSGGVIGWEEVKTAFSSRHPSADERQRKLWAREISPLGQAFDPSKAPNLELLNKDAFHDLFGEGERDESDGDTR